MDPDRSNQPQEREQESAQALLDLAEVIPGEDPEEEGAIYRDMTSATLRALAEPIPQRHVSMNALIERCSARGYSLMFLKDTRGEVRRGIAMRSEAVLAMRREASGGTSTCPHQVLVMRVNPTSSQREMTMVPRQHALQLVEGSRAAPPRPLPSMEELNALQTTAMQRSLLCSMVEAGGGPQLGIPQAVDPNQPGPSQP
jgi:hypothetical protein